MDLASYYRRFITGFSKVAALLNILTQENIPFVGSDACEKSIHQLKLELVSPPLLAYPDFGKEFRLATDASSDAFGAIQSQVHENRERVIAYYSSTLTQTQRRWSTFDSELWAIVSAVRHFRHYLRGQHFTVVTDHQPLLSCKKRSIQDDTTGKKSSLDDGTALILIFDHTSPWQISH